MNVLFACNNQNERQLYRVYLENTISDINISEAGTVDEAITLLKAGTYNAAIVSDQISNGTPGDIFNVIKQNTPGTIFVLLGRTLPENINELDGYKSINEKNTHIMQPLSPKEFQTQILKAIAPSRSSLERVPAFKKVRLIHFHRFNKVLCNVYVQLSDRKYVKVLNANSCYQHEELEKYTSKGVEYFYISNEDFEKFQVTFTTHNYLEMEVDESSPSDALDIMSNTHQVLHELLAKIGFSKEVLELTEHNIKNVTKIINNDPDLAVMFSEKVIAQNYLYDHSFLVAVVCSNIMNKRNCQSPENIHKLCTAAVLHDLAMSNPKLGIIEGPEDTKLQQFSQRDIGDYLSHPKSMANMLMNVDSIEGDVIDIIKNHHETPNGDGFYNVHPSRLSTLCSTFIIAHHYVRQMYKYEFNPDKHESILKEMKEIFNQYNFKAPMTSFLAKENDKKDQAA